jgi:hypothetical protein
MLNCFLSQAQAPDRRPEDSDTCFKNSGSFTTTGRRREVIMLAADMPAVSSGAPRDILLRT